MTTDQKEASVANARQSMNPQTNEEHGNIMPDEERMEEAFKLTASHNIDDPKDKKDADENPDTENANNGSMDDEEVKDREKKDDTGENDNGRLGE